MNGETVEYFKAWVNHNQLNGASAVEDIASELETAFLYYLGFKYCSPQHGAVDLYMEQCANMRSDYKLLLPETDEGWHSLIKAFTYYAFTCMEPVTLAAEVLTKWGK